MSAFAQAGADIAVGGMQMYSAHQTNKMNREMAREQMRFQERMRNTAYQAQVADMKKAGINPMMAVNAGGASSPSGATAQMQDELGQGLSTALKARQATAELEKVKADTALVQDMRKASSWAAFLIS